MKERDIRVLIGGLVIVAALIGVFVLQLLGYVPFVLD
jgi:uncharacterized membrane protein YbaN (DUF454 family)